MNTLYTERLVLRNFREDDYTAMYKNWASDPRVAEYCRWHTHESPETTKAFLKTILDDENQFAITLKGKDEPIGNISAFINSDGIPEIGYVLGYDYWGKGIMTEAVKALIAELFRKGSDKVCACHHVDNPASGKVMEKCGMTFVGTKELSKKFDSEELFEVRVYEIEKNVSPVEYRIASAKDIEPCMESRLEMLKGVNGLPEDYAFDEDFVNASRRFFLEGNQTTVLALDEKAIGCATMCYTDLMPTFSHPTGKRAHLMNVYTNPHYRRQGIAAKMVTMLIDEARKRGVTEISLDATESGRPLYKKLGFEESEECMVLIIK